MGDFVEAARLEEVPAGTGKTVAIAGKQVGLFNVDGQIYAIDDSCPHAGSSLGMGRLDGQIVTCRSHGMKLNVTNGCFAGTPDVAVASYPVKVVDGEIMVALDGPPQQPQKAESTRQ